MKALKEKKGFTLVELLAVIVVLGIVMVLATTTVLPLMEKSQKNAIVTEANSLVESASQAASLLSISSYDGTKKEYKDATSGAITGYCFTIDDLKNAGLWKKTDSSDYAGYVVVKKSASTYEYTVSIHNKDYAVYQAAGNAKADNVISYDSTDAAKTYVCPNALS